MPFRNRRLAKKIAKAPCAWCGWTAGRRHAAHMFDEGPDAEWNAISLCSNCSTVFDEVIRPKFCKALQEYACAKLPQSWRKDNEISERPEVLSEEEYRRLKSKLESLGAHQKLLSTGPHNRQGAFSLLTSRPWNYWRVSEKELRSATEWRAVARL